MPSCVFRGHFIRQDMRSNVVNFFVCLMTRSAAAFGVTLSIVLASQHAEWTPANLPGRAAEHSQPAGRRVAVRAGSEPVKKINAVQPLTNLPGDIDLPPRICCNMTHPIDPPALQLAGVQNPLSIRFSTTSQVNEAVALRQTGKQQCSCPRSTSGPASTVTGACCSNPRGTSSRCDGNLVLCRGGANAVAAGIR